MQGVFKHRYAKLGVLAELNSLNMQHCEKYRCILCTAVVIQITQGQQNLMQLIFLRGRYKTLNYSVSFGELGKLRAYGSALYRLKSSVQLHTVQRYAFNSLHIPFCLSLALLNTVSV